MNRLNRLINQFEDLRIDAFLVTNAVNMRYLTGFSGGQGDGVMLVMKDGATIITDSRFELELHQSDFDGNVVITRQYLSMAAELVSRESVEVLGFESDIAYWAFDELDELIVADLIAFTDLIETLRQQKDAREIAKLKMAGLRTITGLEDVLTRIHEGVSERQVANWLDATMRDLGATGPSFDTIVVSGARSALPHGGATDKFIQTGELVTIDCGYYFDGYTSDVTRTVAVGDPGPELRAVYDVVQTAQEAISKAVKSGVTGAQLDYIGRSMITDAGYGRQFNHGTGHGIGLSIHEGPALSASSQDQLPTNSVITVEPGIYLPQKGGVRLENDLLVLDEGSENLTDSPMELIVLD